MPVFRKIVVFITNLMLTSVRIKFVLFSVWRHSRSVLRAKPFFKQKFLFLSGSLREGSIAFKNSCNFISEGCIQNKKPVSSQYSFVSLFQTTNYLYVKTDTKCEIFYDFSQYLQGLTRKETCNLSVQFPHDMSPTASSFLSLSVLLNSFIWSCGDFFSILVS